MIQKMRVKEDCFCESYLHELYNYPRPGLIEMKLKAGTIVTFDEEMTNCFGSYSHVLYDGQYYDIAPDFLEKYKTGQDACYLKMLEHSYKMTCDTSCCPPDSRLDYLGDYIFNFTTYDADISALFAAKTVEVCVAISTNTTFEYIKSTEGLKWYLLMCNMPFLKPKISWGTSIRGAFWENEIELSSCGIWFDEEQKTEIDFYESEWNDFTSALFDFVKVEMAELVDKYEVLNKLALEFMGESEEPS